MTDLELAQYDLIVFGKAIPQWVLEQTKIEETKWPTATT